MAKKKTAPKSKRSAKTKGSDSWRAIEQPTSKSDSQASRQRRWRIRLKIAGALMVLLLIGGAITGIVWLFRENPIGNLVASKTESVKEITFTTDGSLTKPWLYQFVPEPGSVMQTQIDIFDLKEQLEAQGQVRSATIERILPEGLRITLQEQTPALRVNARMPNGEQQILLVTPEGEVYQGFNYPHDVLTSLPFLAYVDLQQTSGGGWKRIVAAQEVATLCELMRRDYPDIYGNIKYISCAEFNGQVDTPGAVIEIITKEGYTIYFPPTDFGKNLRQLDFALNTSLREGLRPLQYVDLTASEQAVVKAKTTRRLHPIRN